MDIRHLARAATIVVACVLLWSRPALSQPGSSIDVKQLRFLQKAQMIAAAINKHDIDGLEKEFDVVLKRELPADKLKPILWQLTTELGNIEELGDVRFKWADFAVIPTKFEKGVMDMQLVLDSNDQISFFGMFTHKVVAPVPERNSVKLSLPFTGRWNVIWGGESKEQNFNFDNKAMHFGIDVNATDNIGKSHKTDGKTDSDFFAWGKEVVAPADGVVTDAIDGVRDNEPFSANEYEALGNAVIIKLAENEYFVIAHLMRGSVKVKAGDKVTRGQLLGRCGNSGNSTEPRIHFHIQNTPVMQDAVGVKMLFESVGVQRRKEVVHIEKDFAPERDEWVENK